MRKSIVSLVDDLDGTTAAETVFFGVDGVTYEIDLSAGNAAALRQTFATWTDRARRAGTPPRVQPARRRTLLPAVGASRTALIRAWAAENGHPVPGRGRIPAAVVTAYESATV